MELEAAFSVQETDLRLCEMDVPPVSPSIFSASWDRCNRDTALVCHVNGVLRTEHMLARATHCYQLQFQSLELSGNSSTPAKAVSTHWDKMSTIPGRPGELLLVLGVSRALLHTNLPPSSGAFAMNNYVFGRPALQLWAHSARITSLNVSGDGALVCTGDEAGGLRLVQLSKLAGLIDGAPSRTVDPSLGMQHLQAHAGSVFSALWMSSTALATGSSDFAIKLWSVAVDASSSRISIKCIRTLSTLTSHVLAMSFCVLGDSGVLAAGTNTGSLYLWRLPEATATASAAEPELLSLLHSSQHPVVQVAVRASGSRLLVAASDTVGSVRTHSGDYTAVQLVNEAAYSSAVVACVFQQDAPDVASGLLVCTLDGAKKLYSEDIFRRAETPADKLPTAASALARALRAQEEEEEEQEEEDSALRQSLDAEPRRSPPPPPATQTQPHTANSTAATAATVPTTTVSTVAVNTASNAQRRSAPDPAVHVSSAPRSLPPPGVPSETVAGPVRTSLAPSSAAPLPSPPADATTLSQPLVALDTATEDLPRAFLSHASIHSSDALRLQATRLAARIENRSLAAPAIPSSAAELSAAATKAVSSSSKTKRYGALVELSDEQVQQRLPTRPQVGKQVDEQWARRKQLEGPSPEDLAALQSAPPRLEFSVKAGPKRGSGGLRISFDKDTLEPRFDYELHSVDVFGDPNDVTAGGAKETEQRYKAFTDHTMDLIFAPFSTLM